MIETVERSKELPISLVDAKSYLRVDDLDGREDGVIQTLILAAVEQAEEMTDLSLRVGTYHLFLPFFMGTVITIPKNPVISVDKVEYISPITGDYIEWEKENWELANVEEMPAIIQPLQDFPRVKVTDSKKTVKITFRAGYTKETIPEDLIAAMWLDLTHKYDRREDSQPFNNFPTATEKVYRRKKVFRF